MATWRRPRGHWSGPARRPRRGPREVPTQRPTPRTANCTRPSRRRSGAASSAAWGRGRPSAAGSSLRAQLELGELLLADLARLLAEDDHAQDVIGRDVRLRDGVDDPAVVHDADPVGQVEDVVDVVADEEDPDAVVLELAGGGPALPPP